MTREDELDRLLEEKGLLPQAVVGAPRIRQVDEGAAPDEDLFEVEVDTPEGTRKAVVPRAAASYLQYRDTESTVADLPSLKPGQVLEHPRPAPTAPQPKRTAPQVALRAPQAAAPMRPFTSLASGAPRPDLDQEGVAIRPMAEQATNGQRVAGEVAGTRLMDGMQAERPMSPDEQAQQQARDRALAVALGRAGAMAGQAISGAQAPMGLYNAMEQEADLPVRELVARRARERQQRLADPTSEESKRLQAAVSKALPGVYAPEELANIAAEDEPLILKTGEMRQRLEERKAALAAQGQERSEQRAFQAQQQEDEQAFRQQLQREQQRAAAARGGSAAEAGGRIPAGEAQSLGQADFALRALGDLETAFKDKTGWASGVMQFLPGTDAAQYDDQRRAAAQMIGTYMEGGKLTEGDLGKYMNLLPSPGDGAERAQNKADVLRKMIGQRRTAQLEGLRSAGFNTTRFQDAQSAAPAIAPSATGTGQRKQYSKSRNQTRVLDAQGNVIRTEPGDTRGK